jgi:hypothetical protein
VCHLPVGFCFLLPAQKDATDFNMLLKLRCKKNLQAQNGVHAAEGCF